MRVALRGRAALRGREQGADNFREEIAGSVNGLPGQRARSTGRWRRHHPRSKIGSLRLSRRRAWSGRCASTARGRADGRASVKRDGALHEIFGMGAAGAGDAVAGGTEAGDTYPLKEIAAAVRTDDGFSRSLVLLEAWSIHGGFEAAANSPKCLTHARDGSRWPGVCRVKRGRTREGRCASTRPGRGCRR